MREGNFEVLVYNAQTQTLFPEKIIDAIHYVITNPGDEYYVQISVHRQDLNSKWDYKYIRVGLYVDGFDVAYWKRLDFTEGSVENSTVVHAKFWGFKQTESEFRSFKFTDPSKASSDTPSSTSSLSTTNLLSVSQLGQIKVTIHEAIVTDGLFDNKCGQFTVPDVAPVTEQSGVKFWMQPSVGTAAGRTVTGRDEFKPIQKWHNKSTQPSQVLLLKYHTQQTLEIMERCSGESNKPVKRVRVDPSVIVDLTMDDETDPSSSSSSSSSSGKNITVDTVTTTATSSTNTTAISGSSSTNNSMPNTSLLSSAVVEEEDEVVNEEITVVKQTKQVPILDISDDRTAPEWSFTSL